MNSDRFQVILRVHDACFTSGKENTKIGQNGARGAGIVEMRLC